jgi:opacity protein-like surface antigen
MKYAHEKNLKSMLAVAVLAGLSMSASQAASVYLTPGSQTVSVLDGSTSVELWMDFTGEPTIGGGIDLDFQGPISMGVFTPSSYFSNTADPGFTGHGTELADNDYEIHFGDFAGLSGNNKLGDISVNLTGAGLGTISLAINDTYGFFYGIDYLEQTLDLSGADINAVPAPAGVWLLLTGLAGLATRRFARRS